MDSGAGCHVSTQGTACLAAQPLTPRTRRAGRSPAHRGHDAAGAGPHLQLAAHAQGGGQEGGPTQRPQLAVLPDERDRALARTGEHRHVAGR